MFVFFLDWRFWYIIVKRFIFIVLRGNCLIILLTFGHVILHSDHCDGPGNAVCGARTAVCKGLHQTGEEMHKT